ncbi:hypothetical protein FF38_02783 [Lucilia cuprina]|uniref:Vacuolar protein sorting-associated protein 29 n=1 Tax=Lucilia cuprina TaxID=7375 RepID=A0A0L0BYY5_LUCCU|nr:hypothetical protein FF38_02783 [Lucilia cuprina]
MGESDIASTTLKNKQIFTVGDKRIGLVSGFLVTPPGDIDVLTTYARDMNVDILLWGGSHSQELDMNSGHIFINPGYAGRSWILFIGCQG